ncbi:MAG: hypothetical protein PHE94_01260, partial [Eubacteriales bacterium]|nr:hypothetical protein [Eubacteriales bacterium]
MSKKRNRIKHILYLIIIFIVLFSLWASPVSEAFTHPSPYVTAIEGERTAEIKGEKTADYNKLGLNKLDINALSQYVTVENITEDMFYELNFDMKIAAVSMTTEDSFLLRTTENTYFTIDVSEDYITAMELTGVLKPGSSQMIFQASAKPNNIFSFFFFFCLMLSSLLFIMYFIRLRRKSYNPGKLTVNTKEKDKTNPVTQERRITFSEVQGIDELKPDLFRLVDSLKH